jgi:DNA repair protein RecO (recombination protein O)
MIFKTKGIVFRFTRYGETSIIVNIFTELFGLQAYIVNGVRTNKAKTTIALFQPLTLLDLVVYHKENANISRIKEVKCFYPFRSIPTDFKREAVAMFTVEILTKAVKEQSHPQELYEFLEHSLIELDTLPSGVENFHLFFLINLSRHLGFGPQMSGEVLEGRHIPIEDEKILQQLILSKTTSTTREEMPAVTNAQRRELLEILVRFYKYHIEHFGDVKSLAVLREVFE